MAPNVVANRITGREVFKLQENHRDLHLPAVSNLTCTFNIRNLIPTPTTTIPTIVLCFLFLSIFIAQYIRRRCHILSDHRSIESGRLAGDLKTVRFLPSNSNIHNGGEESEKSAILSIMAKKNDMRRQKKEEAATAAPAAVLRKQARTPTPHSGPSRTISLVQGRYTGVVLPAHAHSTASASSSSGGTVPRDVEAWRGVPYAQTTAGVNRFRPPVPLPPYDVGLAGHGQGRGNFKADTFGQVCPSTASADLHAWEGEDCLNLNVYRPAFYDYNDNKNNNNSSALLPVIIYVHGGAFNAGAGTERNMASFVSWAATPLLAVSFNYRVGTLGFPSSVAAEREGCLNLGLRDQRLLFEWVRDNISAFGGDGKRVTIMGMSAGAHSIGYHLQAYTDPATAPFQGAIMESGGPTARATLAPQHPRTENQWREFLDATGIQNNNNNASSSSEQTFAFLRSLPLETILRASNAVFSSYQDPIRWPFQPVIENDASNGQLITDLPISSFRRGKYLPIPILTGFNSNEGSVFCSPRVDTNEQFLDKFTTMIPGLSDKDLEALCKVYPDPVTQPDDWPYYGDVPPGFGRQWARYEAAYAHYAYICPVLQTGHFYSNDDEKKSAAQPPPPIWIYNFAALSRPDFGGKANHVDEAVVVAHDMGAIGQFPGLVATSNAMHGAWVRFIATGNPNPNPPPSSSTNNQEEWWPRFKSPLMGDNDNQGYPIREKRSSDGDGHVMVFGVDNDERMGGSSRGIPALVRQLSEGEVDECRFWWERVELSEGMGRRLAVGGRARL